MFSRSEGGGFSRAMDRSFPTPRYRIFQSWGLRVFLSQKPFSPQFIVRLSGGRQGNIWRGGTLSHFRVVKSISSRSKGCWGPGCLFQGPHMHAETPTTCAVLGGGSQTEASKAGQHFSHINHLENDSYFPNDPVLGPQGQSESPSSCFTTMEKKKISKQVLWVNPAGVKDLRASLVNWSADLFSSHHIRHFLVMCPYILNK